MKQIVLAILTMLSLNIATPVLASVAYADCPSSNSAKGQALQGIGETGSECKTGGVNNLLQTIVEILSIVVGVVAVIMIIVSGLKYMTSGGDAGKVSSAKNTLIYAMIGVAIAALAQFFVHFALAQSSHAIK